MQASATLLRRDDATVTNQMPAGSRNQANLKANQWFGQSQDSFDNGALFHLLFLKAEVQSLENLSKHNIAHPYGSNICCQISCRHLHTRRRIAKCRKGSNVPCSASAPPSGTKLCRARAASIKPGKPKDLYTNYTNRMLPYS